MKVLKVLLLFAGAYFLLTGTLLFAGSEFKDDIQVVNSEIHYSDGKKCSNISCIGTIENVSDKTYEYLVIEVNYFDSTGRLIDTETDSQYSTVLHPKETISFRVRQAADKAPEQYASHAVRITSASVKYSDKYEYEDSTGLADVFFELLISWGPILLLIVVWLIFMARFAGKKSPQKQSLEFLQKQSVLIEEQNQLFSKLVSAVEKAAGNDFKKE